MLNKKVLIVIGHNEKSQGAASASGFTFPNEFYFNLELANLLSCHIGLMGGSGFIVEKSPDTVFKDIVKLSNKIQPDCHIELHCNAFNTLVSGTETLYITSQKLAEKIQFSMVDRLKLRNRGAKELKPGNRGYVNLNGVLSPSVIVEPFFIDNPHDCHFMQDKLDLLALSIAEGINKWLQS